MKKERKKKAKKLPVHRLQRKLLSILRKKPKKQFNPAQLKKYLNSDNNTDSITYALEQLVQAGTVVRRGDYKFQYNKIPDTEIENTPGRYYEGYLDKTRSGAGFVLVPGLDDDVYIPKKYIRGAMNGDLVKIKMLDSLRRRKEGRIVEILERATTRVVARLRLMGDVAVAFPDQEGLPPEIHIPVEEINGARDGDMVVIAITQWPQKVRDVPAGKVVERLTARNESDRVMQSILINHGFSMRFPKEVMEQVRPLTARIPKAEIKRRRDFRQVTTFTIDPEDAKDFDDALSYRDLDNGYFEIGIHIADVTYYMEPDTPLDREAYERATSVYLVDRVCPMLPEKLSNNLCSLRPNVDRLAFSAVFTFDPDYKIKKRWFGRTVIHSDKRFTYEKAQKILDAGKGPYFYELDRLNKVAAHLRKKRFREGAISFETDEIKFKLDKEGRPLKIYLKSRLDTHMLIEDFMLLANRSVAEFIKKKSKGGQPIPFVYRIHDLPEMDKLIDFARFAASMGVKFDIQTPRAVVRSFNKLSRMAERRPELKILVIMGVRTMAKAVYSTDNIGHYGLGFSDYTHFTSPIRRYADVLVHRLLAKNLETVFRADKQQLEAQCRHISNQERKAVDAERESVRYKQVEFLQQFVGEVFEGIIRGIGDRGLFVELLDNFCDGMVPFDSLGDYFIVERGRMIARGARTGRRFKLGDKLWVQVVAADLDKRQVEFLIAAPPRKLSKSKKNRK